MNLKLFPALGALSCLNLALAGQTLFQHTIIDEAPPNNPWVKVLADLNQDGCPDIIVGGQNGPLVVYFYPDWKRSVIAEGGYSTVDGEAGDIDGDGDLDLVLGGTLWYENPLPGSPPDSQLWPAHRIADHPTHDVELADLDNDGDLDVVTRDQSAFSNPEGHQIHIWLQEDSGWTEKVLSCPAGEGLVVADMDNDKDVDIVIGEIWFRNPGVEVLNQNWIPVVYADYHPNASVQTADINGDGRLDIVLAPAELKGQLSRIAWFESPADPVNGIYTEHIIADNVESVFHSLALADVNGDGNVDILTAEMHQGQDPDEVAVFLNSNNGQLWEKIVLSETGSHLIRIADIGNDGDIDFMGANWSGPHQPVELWENSSEQETQ